VGQRNGKVGVKVGQLAGIIREPRRQMGERMLRQMERSAIQVMAKRGKSQRQIAQELGRSRTTIARVLGLFSLVVLLAQTLYPAGLPTRQAAWSAKEEAMFADALAAVRGHLRARWNCNESAPRPEYIQLPRPLWDSVTELLAYAA
jgi:hypothetical protein